MRALFIRFQQSPHNVTWFHLFTRYAFCCRNAADVYRLDKRRWGDEPAVKQKSGVVRKGALRAPLSTADVFWRDRNDDLDSNSEISRETALPSPSPPPPAEQGNP